MIKAYIAAGALALYSIAKAGAADGTVAQASAATDSLMGVTTNVPSIDGDVTDVVMEGPAVVTAGGTFAEGDFLTTDANGHAIKAAPGAGAVANTIGKALESAVAGDQVRIFAIPGQIHG